MSRLPRSCGQLQKTWRVSHVSTSGIVQKVLGCSNGEKTVIDSFLLQREEHQSYRYLFPRTYDSERAKHGNGIALFCNN